MAGIRGGAGLTTPDVIVLRNAKACAAGDKCVRIPEPCNCGFAVNQNKEEAVRAVAEHIKCAQPACCKWTGKPDCVNDECRDTF